MRADQPEVHLCGVTRTWSEAAERRVGVRAAGGGGFPLPGAAPLRRPTARPPPAEAWPHGVAFTACAWGRRLV